MNGFNNLTVIWVSLGLCLTTAIQLRFEAFPIGLGEIMLVIWILFSWVTQLRNKRTNMPGFTKNIAVFWFSIFLFLALGTMMAERLNIVPETLYHNFFALIFSCILCFTFLLQADNREFTGRIAQLTVGFTTIPLFFLYLYGQAHSMLGPIKIWYGDSEVRFQGWTDNPNQLALIIVILLFISVHYLVISKKLFQRIWHGTSIILLILIGFTSDSDAIKLTFVIGGGIICLWIWLNQIRKSDKGYWHGVFLKIVIPLLSISFLCLNWFSIYGVTYDLASSIFEQGDQGSLRMTLWKNGIMAIQHSPFFGLGPGPYSGLVGPFQSVESHNTFIDFGTYTGIFGLTIYLGLLIWLGYLALRTKRFVLFSGIVSLVVFSMFHFVVRHPIYWFFLMMVLIQCLQAPRIVLSKQTRHIESVAGEEIIDKKGHE